MHGCCYMILPAVLVSVNCCHHITVTGRQLQVTSIFTRVRVLYSIF